MTGRLVRLLGLAAVLVALLVGAARTSRAGGEETLGLEEGLPSNPRSGLRVTVSKYPASGRPGGYGFVALRFVNPYRERHEVSAELMDNTSTLAQRFRRRLVLEPGSSALVHMPVPSGNNYCSLVIRGLDGYPASAGISGSPGPARVAVLGVRHPSRPSHETSWAKAIGDASKAGTSVTARPVPDWCDVSKLPSDWRLLSGFDVVILDAGVADLDAAKQEALARYVAGGGSLVLTGVGDATEGPLGEMMHTLGRGTEEGPEGSRGRHGFGHWWAMPDLHPKIAGALGTWLVRNLFGRRGEARPPHVGGPPTVFHRRLVIPGLGEVPVQLFFVLLLAFAIFVGPVTYAWLRRRRRLPWLTLTIPVTGFLVSVVILLYGFLSEGFGIRGSIRSFTLLDQETHTAATVAGRTLYAGLAPSVLVPGGGTLVAPPGRERGDRAMPREVDLTAGGRIAGSALPSRTPTPFTTTTVGRARERLRFRRRDDGTFDVLHGPDLAPVGAEGAVVLRTFDGAVFSSDASGRLVPRSTSSDRHALTTELIRPLAYLPLAKDEIRAPPGVRRLSWGRPTPTTVTNEGAYGFRTWLGARGPEALPEGAYLARVKRAPSLDDLGLEIDYVAAEHVVLGYLAAEDVVE